MNNKRLRLPLALGVMLCAASLQSGAAPVAADPDAADVLDLSQASSLLRVPPRIVRKLAESGTMPARRIGAEWRFNRVAVMEWLQGDRHAYPAVPKKAAQSVATDKTVREPQAGSQRVADAFGPALGSGLSIEALARLRGAGVEEPKRLAQAAAPAPVEPGLAIGEQPAAGPSAEETALREQGIALLKGGAKTVEFGLAYTRQVRDALVQRIEVHTTSATLTGRYGLADDLQITARLPFNYRRTRILREPGLEGSLPTSTLDRYAGDLAVNLLGVGVRENVGRPTVIWSLDAVMPTGPGDVGLGAGVVLSKSYDPVVLFAGANYLHGIRFDAADPRRSLARHNVGFNLGYAYAINDAVALSGQFAGNYRTVRSTTTLPPERESYLVQLGVTWQLGRGLFIDPNVSFGVGSMSPDMTFATNLVYSF